MKNIIIYGASGHGKMIADIILKNNDYKIIGFIDSFRPINDAIYGFKVIGNLDTLPQLIEEHDIFGVIIGIGDNYTRQKIYNKITKIAPSIKFLSAVHPSAILADDIKIPQGAVIMPNVVINANAKIGDFTLLNTKSSLGHDSIMSNFSSLASGVIISGNVEIGICSAICLSASIIQNISIGDHTIIGAGSLVLKSVGDYKQAFGSPIDTIKDRDAHSKYLG
jgi:sugar O-acyltransferase (sialic acid O-acetyltransferase NeuD family)